MNLKNQLFLSDFSKIDALLGHGKSKWNSKNSEFISYLNNTHAGFNATKTHYCLKKTLSFLKESSFADNTIIFLGTRSDITDIIKLAAYKCNQNYMVSKWVPGLLTNWSKKKLQLGEYQEVQTGIKLQLSKAVLPENNTAISNVLKKKATKKFEQIKAVWGGMLPQQGLKKPQLLIVANAEDHLGAIREAHRCAIPTVALVNTNTNPTLVSYPIPCNTESTHTILYILDLLAEQISIATNLKK